MAVAESLTPREQRARGASTEDALGFDRAARAFLRALHRLGAGAVGQVTGLPGSGRTEFLRRCVAVVEQERGLPPNQGVAEFHPQAVWYNPWTYGKQGHPLAGLVAAIARPSGPGPVLERARDLSNTLIRMRFDGGTAEGLGAAFNPGEVDPVERVRRGFSALVDGVKAGAAGRLLVVVADLDLLSPTARHAFLDGVRVLLGGGADVALVLALGRESAMGAFRAREGSVSEDLGERLLAEVVDLPFNVPRVDIRRVGLLLRRHLGAGEAQVRKAFGEEAVNQLAEAVAWRGLGRPRSLERLAGRVDLLAEYVSDGRATVHLQPGQWAWLVVSECWADFRRFIVRGGAARWNELRGVLIARARDQLRPDRGDVEAWLDRDPDLSSYLGAHVSAFEEDAEGLLWMEETLAAAGL